jgi:hypothetical protein
MLRDLYDRMEVHGVTELVVGDVKHIRDNADHGRRELPAEEQIVCSVGEGGIGWLGQIGVSGNGLD